MKKESSLFGWWNAIDESGKQTMEKDEQWRVELGEPNNTIKTEDGVTGFWKIHGNPDQVLVARIGPKGAVRSGASYYNYEMIETLWKTLKGE